MSWPGWADVIFVLALVGKLLGVKAAKNLSLRQQKKKKKAAHLVIWVVNKQKQKQSSAL